MDEKTIILSFIGEEKDKFIGDVLFPDGERIFTNRFGIEIRTTTLDLGTINLLNNSISGLYTKIINVFKKMYYDKLIIKIKVMIIPSLWDKSQLFRDHVMKYLTISKHVYIFYDPHDYNKSIYLVDLYKNSIHDMLCHVFFISIKKHGYVIDDMLRNEMINILHMGGSKVRHITYDNEICIKSFRTTIKTILLCDYENNNDCGDGY